MKKIITIFLVTTLLISICFELNVFATDGIETLKSNMSKVSTPTDTGTRTKAVINKVIGLIQLAGTGISVIVVTLLGIKYILASPSDKADVKKNIMPIIIGCALLFGAVNIVAAIEKTTKTAGLVGSGGN